MNDVIYLLNLLLLNLDFSRDLQSGSVLINVLTLASGTVNALGTSRTCVQRCCRCKLRFVVKDQSFENSPEGED